MSDEPTPSCGRIRVAWEIDFSDHDEFADALRQIAEATDQVRTLPDAIVRYSNVTTGRFPLTDAEWEERFEVVRRVLRTKEREEITLEQACARAGVPYTTFKDWRRKMNGKRGEK